MLFRIQTEFLFQAPYELEAVSHQKGRDVDDSLLKLLLRKKRVRNCIQVSFQRVVAPGFSIHELRTKRLDLMNHLLPRGIQRAREGRIDSIQDRPERFQLCRYLIPNIIE